MGDVALAFTLTLIAGLSTGIGSLIAFLAKNTNTRFLSVSLGFSAGVMIYVSMVEILQQAKDSLTGELGNVTGSWTTVLGFFGGIALIAIIDHLVPENENPHEFPQTQQLQTDSALAEGSTRNGKPAEGILAAQLTADSAAHPDLRADSKARNRRGRSSLMRIGLFTALAIAIHNFPEGLATFISALQEPEIAIPIVVAVAIHNIPEGIAVSVPIYQATGSQKKAFKWSFLSGLAEPVGALVGWLVLMPVMNEAVYGIVFAAVAGIMVFISLDELLPAAREYGEHHLEIYGLIAGMAVMAVSLLLFL